MAAPPYGFRIVGPCSGERRLVDAAAAFTAYCGCDDRAHVEREAYLSAFTFGDDFAEHLRRYGTTKDFRGICGAAFVWWDIDLPDGELALAVDAARRLVGAITSRFAVGDDALLVFYSGSKGFHVGLPTALWEPEPGADFNRTARRFAETVASAAGVSTDAGVYDQVRPFRAPNSRHPKTGLHKRRLTVEELLHLRPAAILDSAKEPEPFDPPEPGECRDFELPAAWNAAAREVREQAEAAERRRAELANGNGAAVLNRITLQFIRDGAEKRDRHRLLYSAARNLGEFGCPSGLAHALLTEAAIDCGLRPSDVRRQIECGLADAAKRGPKGGVS